MASIGTTKRLESSYGWSDGSAWGGHCQGDFRETLKKIQITNFTVIKHPVGKILEPLLIKIT